MLVKEAQEIIGHASGLGKPSKMPGHATSLPASECNVGSKLRKIAGSVCAGCYAFRGNYGTPSVQKGLHRRLAAIDRPRWVEAMTFMIERYTNPADAYFRIHDSGDFQSVEHINRWVQVARQLPNIKFWAPSKEYAAVRKVKKATKDWPENLVIRMSAPMLGVDGPKAWRRDGIPYSTVNHGDGHECPAPTQDNECGDCRACWDATVTKIDYHKH